MFCFVLETGFHHIGQDGLDFLTCDLPASASQSAGITGVSYLPGLESEGFNGDRATPQTLSRLSRGASSCGTELTDGVLGLVLDGAVSGHCPVCC